MTSLPQHKLIKYNIKARGRVEGQKWGQKCPILIFQYVIELEKTNQVQKTGG